MSTAKLSPLRLLVVIASYGVNSDKYLRRLIDEYKSMPYSIDIVVCSNVKKPLPSGVQLIVGMPTSDPWSLPFAHKKIISERANQYDLFIYSEDDTLATEENIEAFLRASEVMAEDEIAGFLRYEKCADGTLRYCDVNGHYHWDPDSVVQRGEDSFAFFTNEHAAFYILTQAQLHRCLQSGGFDVPPHHGKYDLACTAATDPYTQCGFRKLVCISHLDSFLLHHLPNKYLGTRFGTSERLFQKQIDALLNEVQNSGTVQSLVPVETRLRDAWYSKDYYEPVRREVADEIPASVSTVLSVGCGSGEIESFLLSAGKQVTAACLDRVIAACARDRGIETLCGNSKQIRKQLAERTFECLLISNVLHLAAEPESMLSEFSHFLAPNGYCIVLSPNLKTTRNTLGQLRRDPVFCSIGDYERSGTHALRVSELGKWLSLAEIQISKTVRLVSDTKQKVSRFTLGALDGFLANEFIIVGRKIRNANAGQHNELALSAEPK